jgi:hypothetical protein
VNSLHAQRFDSTDFIYIVIVDYSLVHEIISKLSRIKEIGGSTYFLQIKVLSQTYLYKFRKKSISMQNIYFQKKDWSNI